MSKQTNISPDQIRDVVGEPYGSVARTVNTEAVSCCGADVSCCGVKLSCYSMMVDRNAPSSLPIYQAKNLTNDP